MAFAQESLKMIFEQQGEENLSPSNREKKGTIIFVRPVVGTWTFTSANVYHTRLVHWEHYDLIPSSLPMVRGVLVLGSWRKV